MHTDDQKSDYDNELCTQSETGAYGHESNWGNIVDATITIPGGAGTIDDPVDANDEPVVNSTVEQIDQILFKIVRTNMVHVLVILDENS